MPQNDLASKLELSEKTTKSIVWDLQNFNMVSSYGGRVVVNQYLLDTGMLDISRYLAGILKDHIVVREIHKKIEQDKLITQKGLEIVISKIYSCKEQTKDKTLRDYRSRFVSWLLFANLLTKRGDNNFAIPTSENPQKVALQREILQLELPLIVTQKPNNRSVRI